MGSYGSRYTNEDLENNFNYVRNMLGRIPLYNDFTKHTKISINTYANRLSLKGKIYDSVVKKYISDSEYEEYLKSRLNHKSKVGKITGKMTDTEIPKDVLEYEFKKVFDYYYDNYNEYPSRRLFDKIAKHDSSTYRKRYNKSWLDVCKMFGCNIEKNHKLEKIILGMISELIEEKCTPQKTWDWLIGVGGKNMFCDGYFDNCRLVVEYDGRQHRVPIDKFGGVEAFERLQQNDKLKDELVRQHGFKILRIDSRDDWYDEDYLIERLQEIGVKIPNQQIA